MRTRETAYDFTTLEPGPLRRLGFDLHAAAVRMAALRRRRRMVSVAAGGCLALVVGWGTLRSFNHRAWTLW